MRSKEMEALKKRLKLTDRQKEILVGLLLGDGHLETQNGGRTYRLKIEHTLKQKEYVDWLYLEFKEWVMTPAQEKAKIVKFPGREKSEYTNYWFNTISASAFRFYAQQFYLNGKKIVPKLIRKWLTPLALSVWYMDDGSIKSNHHATVLLNTHCFEQNSLRILQDALQRNFGLKTKLRKQKEGNQIYLLSETIEQFQQYVETLIHPSLKYKLPKIWLTQLPKR